MRISDWSSDVCSSDLPFKAESGGIGVGERFGDAVGEMPRTPLIVEAHVEEMRAQAQLHHDADMVEQIAPSPAKAHLDACKEHFGIVITEAAEASSVFRALERNRLVAPGVELSIQRSANSRNGSRARRRGG